jgi:uncharacterized HhH-GPD family protein
MSSNPSATTGSPPCAAPTRAPADRTGDRAARDPGRYDAAMSSANDRLYFSGNPESDRLIASDPLALLIGFVLDQQVTLQKAFSGPLELRRRIGSLDARVIAEMEPARLEAVFRERPALHRFPANMARRVQALCVAIVSDYDGDAARIWGDVADGAELERRLLALPGIGEMKAKTLLAVLVRRLAVRPPGIDPLLPAYPTLGDVDSDAARKEYQAGKRAHKAMLRASDPTR